MHATIYRHAYLPHVTLGRLYVDSLILPTLEEPWIANPAGPGGQRRNRALGIRESCVPDGRYRLIPHTRPNGDRVLALVNPELGIYYRDVDIPHGQGWGRSYVLIHAGNTVDDIEGCILLGTIFGEMDGMPAVLSSRAAVDRFYSVMRPDREHTLTIAPTLGTSERGVI